MTDSKLVLQKNGAKIMLKMLIAEDDLTSCVVLEKILGEYGEPDIATNGRIALEFVSKAVEEDDPYDLICLDNMMPQMDGMETLIAIRAMEKSAKHPSCQKVIMTTVLDDQENIKNAYTNGCDGYIIKPVGKKDISQLIGKLGLLGDKSR